MKLLLDEHYSPALASNLRGSGYDVTAVQEAQDLKSIDDFALLRYAAASGYTLVTENAKDFTRIANAFFEKGLRHHGVVCVSRRKFPRTKNLDNTTEALIKLMENRTDREMENVLLWLD